LSIFAAISSMILRSLSLSSCLVIFWLSESSTRISTLTWSFFSLLGGMSATPMMYSSNFPRRRSLYLSSFFLISLSFFCASIGRSVGSCEKSWMGAPSGGGGRGW